VALSAPNLAANSAMVVNLYSGVVAKVVIGGYWLLVASAPLSHRTVTQRTEVTYFLIFLAKIKFKADGFFFRK
jgi:hypothetical protein